MCLLCDDEAAYRAYMAYLDAIEQQGGDPDLDKAMEAALEVVARDDKAKAARAAEPLAQFQCDPVDE